MSAIGDLVVNLVATTNRFTGPLSGAMGHLSSVSQRMRSLGGGIGGIFNSLGPIVAGSARQMVSLTAIVGGTAGAFSLLGGVTWGAHLANQAENAKIAFTTMLGSASEAKTLLQSLAQFAATTPYESPQVVGAAKQLMAFGVTASEIIPTLTMLGDVSAGIGAPIQDMAYLFGTAKTQGRLFMQDINQFSGRGVPIIAALAETMGVAQTAVKDLVSSGKVGFAQMQTAFEHMTKAGSQFGGGMANLSQSVDGLMSTVRDVAGQTLQKLTEQLFAAFNVRGLLQGVISLLGRVQESFAANEATIQSVAGAVRYAAMAVGIFTAASIAFAVAQRAAAVASIMFQAALSPANLIKIGASLAAAAGVVAAMDSSLKQAGASVSQVVSKVSDLGAAANSTRTAIAGMADAMPSGDGLDGLISRLNTWFTADMTPDPMRGMPELPRIYQTEELLPDIAPHTEKVMKLREALSMVQHAQQRYGDGWGSGYIDQITAHLRETTGIGDAIRDANVELNAMRSSTPDIVRQLSRFDAAGATREQIRELEKVLGAINAAKAAEDNWRASQERRGQAIGMIQELTDRLDVLKGVASETDIALRNLGRQGIDPDQLSAIEKLMRERDALEGKGSTKEQSQGRETSFSAALSKGSVEAVASIQRGQFTSGPKTLESIANKQLKATEELVNLTGQMVDKAGGSSAEADMVADFG